MISRDELTSYLHVHLACDDFNDFAPNGLQVEGRDTINRICTAVTASKAAITEAVSLKADALLVHHGFFWRGEPAVITGMKQRRISPLLVNNLSLYAYHLPLDCHPDLGNNACLGRLLDVRSIRTHTAHNIANVLWSGELATTQTAHRFSDRLSKTLQRVPMHVAGSDKPIKTLAWCSGAAEDFIEEAHQLGVDAYLSGEISERTFYQAQELGIHYFACGHHATERYGIQALGQYLSERFGLTHQFIDSDNPV